MNLSVSIFLKQKIKIQFTIVIPARLQISMCVREREALNSDVMEMLTVYHFLSFSAYCSLKYIRAN